MINGNHAPETVIAAAAVEVPQQLEDIRDAFRTWLPLHRKLYMGARFVDAFTRPRTDLHKVWPQYARWMITDEVYGVQQFLPQSKQLMEMVHEVVKLLELQAGDDTVPEQRTVELMEHLLPWGEKLTSKDHVSAGAAWQVVYNALIGNAPYALRYFCTANQLGQTDVARNVALWAAIEAALKQIFLLLKI